MMSTLTLDFETSIYNKGNPFDVRNFAVSVHTKVDDELPQCKFYDEPDFKSHIRQHVADAGLLVGVNLKFDIHWLRNLDIVLPDGIRVWDCMLAEFILSGQTVSFASLNQLASLYGLGEKEDDVAGYWARGISTEDIPREIVESYGNHDTDLAYRVYLRQLADVRMGPELHKLILLSGLDLLVLEDMEFNGLVYDVRGSYIRADELSLEIDQITNELLSLSPVPINLASGDQLSCFLFGGSFDEELKEQVELVYKSGPRKGEKYVQNQSRGIQTHVLPGFFKPPKGAELKKSTAERPYYSTAEDVLLQLKATTKQQRTIVTLLNRLSALDKLVGTYLLPLPKRLDDMHWADNVIHGQFNQVVARTGRLSSSAPNLQNSPEEVDEFFISRFD